MNTAAGAEPVLWWGTNPEGGLYYAGRVHVVWPGAAPVALCGLPVADLSQLRPTVPALLCPDCCVHAMTALFPAIPAETAHPPGRPPAHSRHDLTPIEHTEVLPTYSNDIRGGS